MGSVFAQSTYVLMLFRIIYARDQILPVTKCMTTGLIQRYDMTYLEYAFERVKIADLTLHNGTKDETSDNLK